MEPDISVEISNLKLRNPLILASGILGLFLLQTFPASTESTAASTFPEVSLISLLPPHNAMLTKIYNTIAPKQVIKEGKL